MISWLVGVVVCLTLMAGCAGTQKDALVKADQGQPELTVPTPDDGADDAALTEELSSKRLEELYAKSGIPGWDPSLEKELKNWDHQVKFDVPIQVNKQVRAYLVYFSTDRKRTIRRYLARSTRYLPLIKRVFQEAGLPEDLAYLAMIESGFNNKAYSPAAACGMWQFIKGTGLRYGLEINRYVDERRDPEKATRAAAHYLLDLYKQFGSWYLAAASYNCGENRVQRELDTSNHKNFWELSANRCLPSETKNYVPQMIAATIIAKNPEKFGFKNIPYLPPLKCDKVKVNESTSVTAAAAAVNVPPGEIAALNPELLRGVTPPDAPSFTLNLPPNSQELFTKNITLARIEHPAVASHPIRTARSSKRSYHHRSRHSSAKHRSSGHHRVKSASRHVELAQKRSGSTHRTYARSRHKSSHTYAKRKKSARTYAKREKSNQHRSTPTRALAKNQAPAGKGAAPVVQASMFGVPSLASRHRASKTNTVRRTQKPASSSHAKRYAAHGKKCGTRLARKMNSAKRHSKKSSRKDKYSRARGKSRRAIMVSEAR